MTASDAFETARRWVAESFMPPNQPSRLPISFRYGDRDSAALMDGWTVQRAAGPAEAGVTRETVTLTDPETGLECRCEITAYTDFPAVEWVVYFKNTGAADTPILAEIQALDSSFVVGATTVGGETFPRLHHAKGSSFQLDDFLPQVTWFRPGYTFSLTTDTGRSSTRHLPFFNIEGDGDGVICAVGWTGNWTASFARPRQGNTVRVRAGMERTHLRLHPGEEIRTPRILLLFWEGDRIRSHNTWRRLILAHHTPNPLRRTVDREPQIGRLPISDGAWGERPVATHLEKIRWLKENALPASCFWIDAGWYGERTYDATRDTFGPEWAMHVGSWTPIKGAYPDGLKPVGDAAREAGLDFLLWFEPERAFEGTALTREHPEWLLGPVKSTWLPGNNYLVNLGNPEARRFMADQLSALINEFGITWYRQDFNVTPTPFWQAADAPDRVGMAEIGHITGLYALWDELLARHPGLLIDNCAGGGQRIDLEMISRSVPLWRSDVQCYDGFDPIVMQTQAQGLAPWVPLSVGVAQRDTTYSYRSALGAGLIVGYSGRAIEGGVKLPLDEIRRLAAEYIAVRKYLYGDFYPLTSCSLADDAWATWQYDRSDLGEGIVLAFRRQRSPFAQLEARLSGLDPLAEYDLISHDGKPAGRLIGQALMTDGFTIEIAEQPGSALFVYKRVA